MKWAGIFSILLLLVGCSKGPLVPLAGFDIEIDANGAEQEEIVSWFHESLSANLSVPERNVKIRFTTPTLLSAEVPATRVEDAKLFLSNCRDSGGVIFAEVHRESATFDPESADIPEGWHWIDFRDPSQGSILVENDPYFDESAIASAERFYGAGGWALSVNFTPEAADEMGKFTKRLVNERIAIIVGEEVISAPVVREPFSTGASITGDFTEEEIAAMEAFLNRPGRMTFRVR